MPASVTHAYYSLDVYEKLNDNLKNKLQYNLEDLKTFSQGPDVFYFYNIFIGSNFKKIISFGNYMHKNKTRDFFVNLIKYINEFKLMNDPQVMSFLYGFICHYTLDSTVHPFIYYKTGIFNRKKKNTYKYNGLHNEMEYFLDVYMIFQKERKEAKYFKSYNFLMNTHSFGSKLCETMDYTFKKTFNQSNMCKSYFKSMKYLKLFFKYFHHDHYGVKKYFFKLVDVLTPLRYERKDILSYNVSHKKKIHYLNLEKSEWNHPMDINERYNHSFIELYIISIDKAVKLIEKIDDMLEKNEVLDEELNILFKNTSYLTGKDCDNKEPMKYFEF